MSSRASAPSTARTPASRYASPRPPILRIRGYMAAREVEIEDTLKAPVRSTLSMSYLNCCDQRWDRPVTNGKKSHLTGLLDLAPFVAPLPDGPIVRPASH